MIVVALLSLDLGNYGILPVDESQRLVLVNASVSQFLCPIIEFHILSPL